MPQSLEKQSVSKIRRNELAGFTLIESAFRHTAMPRLILAAKLETSVATRSPPGIWLALRPLVRFGQLAQVVPSLGTCQSTCAGCPMALEIDPMKDQRVPVMMSADDVAAIDAWRRKQEDLPSRSEAIRRLVELGLKVKK